MADKTEKNITRLLLVRIPTSALTFGYTILLARMLQPEQFGNYQYINTNIQLLIMVFGLNAASGLVYFSSKSRTSESAIKSLAARLLLVGLVLVTFLLSMSYFFQSIHDFLIPGSLNGLFWSVYFLLSYAFLKSTLFFESLLKGNGDFKGYNRSTIFAAIASTLAYGIGFFLFKERVRELFLIILCAQGLGAVIMGFYWYTGKPSSSNSEMTNSLSLQEYWNYVRSGYASQLTRFMNKRFDVWIIERFQGVLALGFYQLAASFNQFVLTAIQPANQMMMRQVQPENLEVNLYARHVRVLSSVVLLGTLVLMALFPLIIPALFGKSYGPAVRVAQILAPTSYFVFLTNALALYNYTHQRLRYTWYAQLLGLAIIIVLDFAWIPQFGIEGAAWASLISYGATAGVMLYIVPRALGQHVLTFLIPRRSDFVAYLK